METAIKTKSTSWAMERRRGERQTLFKVISLSLLHLNRLAGKFYNKIGSKRKIVVSENYFRYLANSIEYRSDLTRIARSFVQLLKALS